MSYTYAAQATCNGQPRSIAHAVSAVGGTQYGYDCNGNMIQRNVGGSVYNLTYDGENRLTAVGGAATWYP